MMAGGEGVVQRVLVVEDEEAIAEGIAFNLRRKGYEVFLAGDGRSGLAAAMAGQFDLILLDVRLPGIDGFEVCQRLRQTGDFTPILMLTARSQPDDVVYGLKSGADDYVTKPFDLAELLARIEGLLRRLSWSRRSAEAGSAEGSEVAAEWSPEQPSVRVQPAPLPLDSTVASRPSGGLPGAAPAAPGDGSREGSPAAAESAAAGVPLPGSAPSGEPPLVFGPFWVDFQTWQAETRSGVVELSQKEVAVMRLFASRPRQVITRRELLTEVWQLPHHPNTRVVDNVIVALRKHFEENAWRPRHIQSVRGAGYRFVP